jgi:uncharacterized protein (TIGR00266 family)
MQFEVKYSPHNSVVRVQLGQGESFTAEAGAMISMSGSIDITTTTQQRSSGGILKAIKRVLSGESFFLNHFSAKNQPGEVWIAPVLPGDIKIVELTGNGLVVQGSSWLACTSGVSIDLNFQGIKSLFAGESLFWLKAKGTGSLCLSSFGSIYEVEVNGDAIVDSGHIVAFDDSLSFSLTKAGSSWMSPFLGGEGIVTKFQGRGRVWCQSHSPRSFGMSLAPFLRAKVQN